MAEILREIGMIARALDSIANIEFKEFDLTRGQYLYLIRICENPGIIQEKLADMIKVDRTTASRAIKKLEANGFIEKRVDSANRKIKHIFPTEKGNEISPNISRENEHSERVALQGLSEDGSGGSQPTAPKGPEKRRRRLGIREKRQQTKLLKQG